MRDLARINRESEFSKAIRNTIEKIRPSKLIETGTYQGMGSTALIASCLRDLGLKSEFFSIEANPTYVAMAKQNLSNLGLSDYVTLVNGLSIKRRYLPTKEELKAKFVDQAGEFFCKNIYVDHDKDKRVDLYFRETNFPDVPDDMLKKCIQSFCGKIDFLLLDSGGHLGEIEFDTAIRHIISPCMIALDDIYHVKHFNNFYNKIKGNTQFEIAYESREKFGFCIAFYYP